MLCVYLFSTFTIKQGLGEGMNAEELGCLTRWRAEIRGIMVQEMLHLATACNLLIAVGGAPQLKRPTLPTSPHAYPPAFKLQLVPFGMDALEQFIFLERPEGLPDDNVATPESAFSLGSLSDIFSSERNYETLGQLYRGIEDGLTYLSQKYGEEQLFINQRSAQTDETFFSIPGLIPVHDLQSALEAVKVIIDQGEGASSDAEDSHYRRFSKMRQEYLDVLEGNPDFHPSRPVLMNPYTRLPGSILRAWTSTSLIIR